MARLIDADALIDLIKERNCSLCRDNDNRHNNWHCRECEYNEVMSNIENAPTIEAEPTKHGRWIDRGKDMCIRWKCSECGRKDTHIYNYCPDCGALMIDEVE